MALENEFTPEEQAQFEQMRAADNEPQIIEPEPQQGAVDPEPPDSITGAQEDAPVADKRSQMVPHAALHEERERRKAVEAQIAEERKARQTLEERTNLLLQRLNLGTDGQPQPASPAAPEIPKIEEDPVGHLLGQIAQQRQVIDNLVGAVQQRSQQDQHAQTLATIQQRAMIAEREFRQQTEDYDAAVAHLLTAREKVLDMAGYADPAARQQMIAREALDVANRALQMGRNPAQMIYELAQAHGYQKKAPAPAEGGNEGDGADQAAARAPLTERIAQQERGQQQDGRTLSGVRGSGPRPLTAQRLAEMGADEFMKMMDTPEGRELMGA